MLVNSLSKEKFAKNAAARLHFREPGKLKEVQIMNNKFKCLQLKLRDTQVKFFSRI